MSAREYAWTEAGKRSAERNGVEQTEAIQAIYSPRQFTHRFGDDLLAVFGETDKGRVVMVLMARYADGVNTFMINGVRAASQAELEEWRRRTG